MPRLYKKKLQKKHNVISYEAQQILFNQPRFRFGEDVYAAFGQTLGGRYLSVFFIYKPENRTAIIISARNMSKKDRRAYGRK